MLKIVLGLCDTFLMVNFCQDPVPERSQEILEPSRICRTIDTMEAVLQFQLESQRGSAIKSKEAEHVLSWFLHKFGLEKIHHAEEQTCQTWQVAFRNAGFIDVLPLLEPQQPWPLFILSAASLRPVSEEQGAQT
jgi:hypothetical protein